MELFNRVCPICGISNESVVFLDEKLDETKIDSFTFASRKLPEYMHYRLMRCKKCDLIYGNPVPNEITLAKLYNNADFDSSNEALYASYTYGKLLSFIIPLLPDTTGALDIGTGDGAFLEQLLKTGFKDVSGIEPSKAPIETAKPWIKPLINNRIFCPNDYEPNSFSLITCFQTLEHLYNPIEACKGIYSLLKHGGAAYFVTHNYRSFSTKLLGEKSPIFDIEHLQLYSPISMKNLLEKSGFSNIKVVKIKNTYPFTYWTRLVPISPKLKGKILCHIKETRIGNFLITMPVGNIAVIGFK